MPALARGIAISKDRGADVRLESAKQPKADIDHCSHPSRYAYCKTDAEIIVALADALKEEYKAIVDAGFILQLDDAFLAHEYDRLSGEMSERAILRCSGEA